MDADVNIDELLSLGSSSFDARLTNPVHMELQENARLPTFYGTVDRSGSSSIANSRRIPEAALHSPTQQQRKRSDSGDINWGELFLNDRHRVSYHGNYKEAGVLKEFEGFPGAVTSNVDVPLIAAAAPETEKDNELNEIIINVEPTPLSEIKRRVEERQQQREHRNEGSRHHPYSRSTPLLVPTYDQQGNAELPITMAQALATAAALASTTHRPLTSTGMSKLPPASAGVLRDISTKKKKHGFGPNHVVPSVPTSNTGRKSRKRPPPVITTNQAAVPMGPPFSATASHDTDDHEMQDMNPGDAYERKKQRAKDARVKLNESIDRMHISIRLALTQSQQRLQQSQQNNLATSQKERIVPLLQQTIRIAETAKKWDRPSFVGSAAALIQMLNAQCEALMQMVVESNNGTAETGTPLVNGQNKRYNSVDDSIHSNAEADTNNGNKRMRCTTEFKTEVQDDGTLVTQGRILECIASFLDPKSLIRCHFQVCKAWTTLGSFGSDPVWESLVLQRFGFYCVRQWRDKLLLDDSSSYPSFRNLYKSMDTANAMPHIASIHQNEGWFLLGETRLPGTISAWVYLIERSNGETLRSVHQASTNKFQSLPIVELRTVLQNTGTSQIVWKMDQTQSVDTSTRRRAEEMKELQGDGRFQKRVLRLDGPVQTVTNDQITLRLFESAIVVSYIHATNCNTISKFVQKSNFTRWLVQVNGTTVPLVIPFPRDALGLQH